MPKVPLAPLPWAELAEVLLLRAPLLLAVLVSLALHLSYQNFTPLSFSSGLLSLN